MTNERDKEAMDKLVSETYRELPAPRTPDHLNRSILHMAANKRGGGSNFLFAAWMKPVAWAAVIALSLAIVLEFSELPTAAIDLDAAPATDASKEAKAESVRERFTTGTADTLEQAVNRARSNSEPGRTAVNEAVASTPAEIIVEELVLEDADPHKGEARGKLDSFAVAAPARPAARKLATDQAEVEQTAKDQLMEEKESDAEKACDEKARQSAVSWLECIDNLRISGAVEDAEREYEAFVLEYPIDLADSEPNR